MNSTCTPLFLLTAVLAGGVCGCAPQEPVSAGRPLAVDHQIRPWRTGETPGTQLLTKHYQVFTTSRSPHVLKQLPGFLEAAHENYLEVTGLDDRPANERMQVYMMATRQEWASLTKSIVGPRWNIYSSISAGGFCYRGVGVFWDIGSTATLAIASHEGLHQFLEHRLTDRLPMWMEEGLAAICEGYTIDEQSVAFTPGRNNSRFSDLRQQLVQGWWIPLERLLTMDAGDAIQMKYTEKVVGYYGQVWALSRMLLDEPDLAAARARLLADAEAGRFRERLGYNSLAFDQLKRRGRTYNRTVSLPIFEYYISKDIDAFEKRYKAYAMKLARLE